MTWIRKYAELLAHYSLYLKKGELVYLRTTTLAHELVSEFSKICIDLGVRLEVEFDFQYKEEYLLRSNDAELLNYFSPHKINLISNCDAYILIRAPYSNIEKFESIPESEKIRTKAINNFQEIYFKRLGDGSLKRNLCQYPTESAAQLAGMSLDQYIEFIIQSCSLNLEDPSMFWKELSKQQTAYVDYLNKIEHLTFEHNDTKISCRTQGRTWINSDGKSNMPSGEVFTSPIEDSVDGEIFFNYPTVIFGEIIEDIHLVVEKGFVQNFSARIGQKTLEKVFSIEGARRFGEVAIGTNFNIQKATNNILFDEKIGGSVHMAVGQSYYQCGGINKSSIHWDLIKDMKQGGKIYADSNLIYENGKFLI